MRISFHDKGKTNKNKNIKDRILTVRLKGLKGRKETGGMLRYRKLSDSGCDIGRGTTSRNEPLTTVGPVLCGCGTVCPIRSDRYCTPPYNLHGLMTSITLLRASDRSRRPLPWPRSRCATRCVLVPIPRQRTHGTHARISHRSVE